MQVGGGGRFVSAAERAAQGAQGSRTVAGDQAELRLGFTLNGSAVSVAARPDETLLDVLRLRCGVGSARESCGLGVCGACTALVDGRPVCSCLYPAALADGGEVVTVEGLGGPGALHPIQEAFLAENAFQCGYCTPGFVLMTWALLRDHPDPDDDLAREFLTGNLCRCGSYENILRAVRRAAKALGAGAGA
jgi:carbon-monoxide dehydrogenase small subunit